MIVEDDAELRDLLVEMLRADGFLVTSAANAVPLKIRTIVFMAIPFG